jgi:nicotinamidase-related amidase
MKAAAHASHTRSALLLVDFINPMDFAGANALAPRALAAAAARLKSRLRRARVPVIYANDNFGAWRADFAMIVDACRRGVPAARKLVATIAPASDDLSILKPRHSAFFGTPLEFLLDELRVNRLIIAGLTTDNCVMFTAHDAYLRKLAVFVPSNCSAAKDPRDHRAALRHIRTVLKGRTARA